MTGMAGGGGGRGSSRRAAAGKDGGGRSRSAQPRAAGGGSGSGGGSEEEEQEQQRDGGSLFLVNKSGFPMDGQTWERMWGHVERVHPDGGAVAAAIRSATRLARVRRSPLVSPRAGGAGDTEPWGRRCRVLRASSGRGGSRAGREGGSRPEDALGAGRRRMGHLLSPERGTGTAGCSWCLGEQPGRKITPFSLGRKKQKTRVKSSGTE